MEKRDAACPEETVCKSGAFAAGATSLAEPLDCSDCPKGYITYVDYNTMPVNLAIRDHIHRDYLCGLQYDAGKFGDKGSHTPRYFYSKSLKNCMLFTFYGRDGNANNFATYNECKDMCMT
ncbi:Kunitz/Bovine pancreatic trypsin inhibitor domain protein [Teladorsagia circumcincta]|uniref:Kunitz/Bovine pancreatic trypsin inhibitor domain protein n=1 Tax=Teladorsagia circumcincta TaxID=45464 RepID=A0A2G9U524_TELCI|nr:Kunitz/Bovine pancreatic trypsin inhibitor domain protein [Teladorsagia circumcincta]